MPFPAQPQVILEIFECPICGARNEVPSEVVARFKAADEAAAKVRAFVVQVDRRSECRVCVTSWNAERAAFVDLRSSRSGPLGGAWSMTIVVSHARLAAPERLIVPSNEVAILLRMLGGELDEELRVPGAAPSTAEITQWYASLARRVGGRSLRTEF